MSQHPDHHQFDDTTADKVDLSNVVPIRPDAPLAQQPAPVKKTRKPPKPGPVQRQPDESHRIPLNVGLQATDKMKMLRVIARDNRLTVAQKVVAIPLVDNVNSEVGHSFISWDALGSESGLGWQAAKGAADRLKELGYVNIDHIQGGVVHMSLNLDKIHTPKPERKRTLSRDEAREKAAAKKAGKEMSDQTSPSQQHVGPVEMCSETSPEMYHQTSGEMYGATSGAMYGQTSESEIPLREVIQRSSIGEGNRNNGVIDADAPPPSLCPRGASLKEEPASPKGVPLPGYDSKTFAGHLPSFATTWPADPHPEGVDGDEVDDVYDLIRIEWAGKEGDARKAVAKLMVIGWTANQLRAPMEAYNERLDEMDNHEMLLIAYLGQEFDLGGKHVKAWEDRQGEREKRHRVNTEAPTISEKPVSEAPIAALVTSEPVIRELDAIKVAPVVTTETKWGEPAWDDLEGNNEDLSFDGVPLTEADRQATAERKARVDAIAAMTPAERKARTDKLFAESRAYRARMKAEREAAETPYERSKREAAEDIERRKKEQAEFKRQKAEADRVSKPTSPASAYPLSAPSGKGGGLRRLSDYVEVPF